MFTLWTGHAHRATRDMDLLGFGEPSVERLRAIVTEVVTLDIDDDGVVFDPSSLKVEPIREDQLYGLANTRMKDFYDLVALSNLFEFEGQLLVDAISATFKRRGTTLPADTPTAFRAAFTGDSTKTCSGRPVPRPTAAGRAASRPHRYAQNDSARVDQGEVRLGRERLRGHRRGAIRSMTSAGEPKGFPALHGEARMPAPSASASPA